MMKKLTHIDGSGKAAMVDISAKPLTRREAAASCFIKLSESTVKMIKAKKAAKGEVLGIARIAGIAAAKRTWELIPLTHNIPLSRVEIEMEFSCGGLGITCRVKCDARTGAEMEALTGAAVAALTVYDMIKAAEKGAVIGDLRLEYKSGGKSGVWKRVP